MKACMIAGTGILLLSLLVVMAGLYMLAHSKKENLNKFYSISALVAVIFSSSVFIFGIAGGIMCMACGKCKDNNGGKMKRHMMMMQRMHGGGSCYMMNGNGGMCEMGGGSCEMGGNGGSCYRDMKCGGGMEECHRMQGCREKKECKMDGDKETKEVIIKIDGKDGKKTETKTEIK
ncbi:MAG: hypothetical protein ACHQF2_00540 [Flavobacteriales bacterium]